MKILKIDSKNGIVKLICENADDFWHLEHVLEPEDLIKGKTSRKTSIKRGSEIKEGDRKPVTLTIRLEKFDFHESSGKLRLTGKIVEGPHDISLDSYHTIQVEKNLPLTIRKKKWKNWQIDRLRKAKIKHPLLFICVIDREQADFAILKESGVDFLGSKFFKKTEDVEKKRKEFYAEIINYLKKQDVENIILAGPGFEYQNFLKYIKEKNPELKERIFPEHTSCTGITGIREVIKNSASKILGQTRIAKETGLIEDLLKEIKTEGMVTYGKKETAHAIDFGAVKTLLISEKKIREFEELMELAEKKHAEIKIISCEHEAGEQFLSLGGIAAFLRFRFK